MRIRNTALKSSHDRKMMYITWSVTQLLGVEAMDSKLGYRTGSWIRQFVMSAVSEFSLFPRSTSSPGSVRSRG